MSDAVSRRLVAGVLLMTLVVLGLGGAVLALKLRPAGAPATAASRDLATAQQAVTADPKDDWAQTALGLAYLDAGRDREARQAFETAIDLNDENWLATFQLGLLVATSDGGRALELLERAAELAPRTNKAGPLVALGDLQLEEGDALSAKKVYREAIADTPFLYDAHLGLARALEALGDEKGALQRYREAARFNPDSPEVAEAIARLQGGAG